MSVGTSLEKCGRQQNQPWLESFCHTASQAWKLNKVTTVIAATTVMVFMFPGLTAVLQLDFNSIVQGQWWRLLTGHLTHYDGQHLFWDLLMFVVLGVVCERQYRKLFAPALVLMATVVSVTVFLSCHGISEYRGLSGIDTGLFAWLIIGQLRASLTARDRYFSAFWTACGLSLIGKLFFEMLTGDVLFVQTQGFEPMLESHLAGAAVGVTAGLVSLASLRQE